MNGLNAKDAIPAPSGANATAAAEECRLLKLDDLCQYMNVSIAQLQKLRRAGKIMRPTTTIGRSPRWLDHSFFSWMRAGCPPEVFWTGKEKGRNNGR